MIPCRAVPGLPGAMKRVPHSGLAAMVQTGNTTVKSIDDLNGKVIRDPAVIERINKLAIPPAYTDVWISPDPRGHIQATGRDDRGRKQYRYHADWKAARDETKFARMAAFGRALRKIRARVEQDLSHRGLPKEKVLAAVVAMLLTA